MHQARTMFFIFSLNLILKVEELFSKNSSLIVYSNRIQKVTVVVIYLFSVQVTFREKKESLQIVTIVVIQGAHLIR